VQDAVKGQVPLAFAVAKDTRALADAEARQAMEREVLELVDRQVGAIGRPARVLFVTLLPKTRSGKVLRRSIQALAEGREPGDLTTLDDPAGIEQIRNAVAERNGRTD
jgi:propionyl-CoA synthetase